jgi:hypothetical protein
MTSRQVQAVGSFGRTPFSTHSCISKPRSVYCHAEVSYSIRTIKVSQYFKLTLHCIQTFTTRAIMASGTCSLNEELAVNETSHAKTGKLSCYLDLGLRRAIYRFVNLALWEVLGIWGVFLQRGTLASQNSNLQAKGTVDISLVTSL